MLDVLASVHKAIDGHVLDVINFAQGNGLIALSTVPDINCMSMGCLMQRSEYHLMFINCRGPRLGDQLHVHQGLSAKARTPIACTSTVTIV